MPPAVPLFAALVLILAQAFHVISPRRVPYPRRLLLAILGVTVGEFLGSHGLPEGPRLGDLHPGWDLAFTAILQLLGNRFLRSDRGDH
ncbi:MAG: hypothetical protein ACYDGR_09050 [Candidatus Dormibacteria bacterium]